MNLFIPSAAATTIVVGGSPGYYGSFYDAGVDQVAADTVTAYPIRIASTYSANGVSITGAGNTRITFANAGVYTVAPSLQLTNTHIQEVDVDVWYTLNGSIIADSNSRFGVPSSHGGDPGHLIGNMALTLPVSAGQYVELYWCTTNVLAHIHTFAAGATPTRPAVPGVIVSVTSQAQVGGT